MAQPEENNAIYWYDPDPRTILPLDTYHVPKRLKRIVRQNIFEVRFNTNFEAVMRGCAETATPKRSSTWISEDIIRLYTSLHDYDFAHSVECYQKGQLVGGVYGVAVGGLFAGESMFSRVPNASKVALVHLLAHLVKQGYSLFDVQFSNPHLLQFGVQEIARNDYHAKLELALQQDLHFL